MAKLSQAHKDFIDQGEFCNAATANRQGVPNVSPKGSIMWLDDETIAFCDWGSVHTRENLKENPKIAVSIVNPKAPETRFLQFKGTADLASSGERYREVADKAKSKIKQKLPDPTNVVVIRVEEIFSFPPAKS
jgi:predicted pyridoxine 5'-phosphate oxidase superfamily flavin-nucleotide-binding protein